MTPELTNGLFAIGGALIGVIGSLLIAHFSKKKSKLTISRSMVGKLLDIKDMVKSEVQITYKNKEVSGLYNGQIIVHNTGNQCVENIEIKLEFLGTSPLIDIEYSEANFKDDESFIIDNIIKNKPVLYIPFLNFSDHIIYTYTLAGEGKRPNVNARIKNVDIEIRDTRNIHVNDIYVDLMFNIFASNFILRPYLSLISPPFRKYLKNRSDGAN